MARYLREHFSFDARKLLQAGLADKSDSYLQSALAAELNVFLQGVTPLRTRLPVRAGGVAGSA